MKLTDIITPDIPQQAVVDYSALKVKQSHTGLGRPLGLQAPRFLGTGRLYPPGKIMSVKNSNDTIGNQTRDVPVCSAVPQPTAPPRAPLLYITVQ